MNLSVEQMAAITLLSKMDSADRNVCITAALVEGNDSGEILSALTMVNLTALGFVHQCESAIDKYSKQGWQKVCAGKLHKTVSSRLDESWQGIEEIQTLVGSLLGAELVEGDE